MGIECFTRFLLKPCNCVLFLTCLFGGQLGEGWEREFLFCSFSTPADGTEAAANLKGSAHSADPQEKQTREEEEKEEEEDEDEDVSPVSETRT